MKIITGITVEEQMKKAEEILENEVIPKITKEELKQAEKRFLDMGIKFRKNIIKRLSSKI